MKKLLTLLICGLIFSTHIFAATQVESDKEATTYEELYYNVVLYYGEERVQDLNNIWKYAAEHGVDTITWEQVKNLLDNPTELEVE